MITPKITSDETRLALVEHNLDHIFDYLRSIKTEVSEGRKENKEEYYKIWNKLESLDNRINDNYKYLDQKIDNRFSDVEKRFLDTDKKIGINFKILLSAIFGLYATVYGGMVAKFFNIM